MAEGTSHGTARPCDPDNASYARELDRAHNLSRFSRRDRNRSRSLQGRVTAAPPMPEALDFMPGWVTSRHEGCVSTMLADKRLEYCTAGAPLQGSVRRNGGASRKARHFGVLSVLTSRGCDGSGNRRRYLLSLICIKRSRSAWIHRYGQTPWCPVRREWPDAGQQRPYSNAAESGRSMAQLT